MRNTDMHLVSFDVPFPPDYGGAVDVYWKLKALHDAGVRVHLHAFAYGDKPINMQALQAIAHEITIYNRPMAWHNLLSANPFIVQTRKNDELLEKLTHDKAPILFEGVHTTAWLGHDMLKKQKQALRVHNFEAEYYKHLSKATPFSRNALYFWLESKKLKRYEANLWHKADFLYPISTIDAEKLPKQKTTWLPAFYDETLIASKEKSEQLPNQDYYLFHGNLSVADNALAATFLTLALANIPNLQLVIAGKQPSKELLRAIQQNNHVSLIADPDDVTMNTLLHNCKAHILWTFQQAGVKLKLLHALKTGRPVICPPEMVLGSGLEQAVFQVNTANELIELINHPKAFSIEQEHSWQNMYNNKLNAEKIINTLLA